MTTSKPNNQQAEKTEKADSKIADKQADKLVTPAPAARPDVLPEREQTQRSSVGDAERPADEKAADKADKKSDEDPGDYQGNGAKPEVGQRVKVFTSQDSVGSINDATISRVTNEHPDGGWLVDLTTNPEGAEREQLTSVRLLSDGSRPSVGNGHVAYPPSEY